MRMAKIIKLTEKEMISYAAKVVANKLKGKLAKAEIVDNELHITLEDEEISKKSDDDDGE